LRAAAGRRWRERPFYRTTGDWLLSLYDRTLKRCPRLPLPGRKAVCPVALRDFDRPLYARLGSSDFLVIDELFIRREYDFLFTQDLGPIRLVVDLGANCGYSALLWLTHFPAARIIAVEPDAGNIAVLRRNLAAFEGRATVVEACVAGRSRDVYLNRDGQEWEYAMSDAPGGRGPPVPALTLPQILDRCRADGPIDLLKCDIEGAERELFAAAGPWLSRVRNLLVEVHAPYTADELSAAVAAVWGRFDIRPVSPPDANQLFFLRPL
jgi:FkbM family methyltransferase